MFIAICSIVPFIISNIRYRSKKIGYKYIYVRTNQKEIGTRNEIAQSLERQGIRPVPAFGTRWNDWNNVLCFLLAWAHGQQTNSNVKALVVNHLSESIKQVLPR